MKKTIFFLFLSTLGFSQGNKLLLSQIQYAPGSNYCTVTNSLGVQTYTPCNSVTGLLPTTTSITINGSTKSFTSTPSYTVGDLFSTSSYTNPPWLSSLAWSKITGTPTSIIGYGITDPLINGNLTPNYIPYAVSSTSLANSPLFTNGMGVSTDGTFPYFSGIANSFETGNLGVTGEIAVGNTGLSIGGGFYRIRNNGGYLNYTSLGGHEFTNQSGNETTYPLMMLYTDYNTTKDLFTVTKQSTLLFKIKPSGAVHLPLLNANSLIYTNGSNDASSLVLGSGLSLSSGTLSATGTSSTTTLTGVNNVTVTGSAPNYTVGVSSALTTSLSNNTSAISTLSTNLATKATAINYYNVKDYGAVGDGTTDDAAAILLAANTSYSAIGSVNLEFPHGVYKVNSQIDIDRLTANVNIKGNGATLKSGISVTANSVLKISSAASVDVEKLRFDFNANTTIHYGLRLGDEANSKRIGVARISNCDFYNFGVENQRGILVENTPATSGLTSRNTLPSVIIKGCNFYNLETFELLSINYNTATLYGIGIELGENSDNTIVTDCNFDWIRIGVFSTAGANLTVANNNFICCMPKLSGSYAFGVIYVPNTGGNNGKINIIGNKINHNYGYSIYFKYATAERPLTITGNQFIANCTTPIYMTHTSTISTQSMIQNNYFERASQAYSNSLTNQPFGATLQPFIYLNNQLNVTVKNNKFLNDASYAIQSAGSSDYTTAQLNQIGNTTGTYSLVGANSITETGSDKLVYSVSPALTGTPTAPTAAASSSNTTIANTAYVDRAIASVPGGGDMLKANNLSDVTNTVTARNNILPSKTGNSLKVLRVNSEETDYEVATFAGGGDLVSTNNLSDISDPVVARNNLAQSDLFMTGGNVTTTLTAAQSVPSLSFTATANKRYNIKGLIHIGCNNSGGVKIQITYPSGATSWVHYLAKNNTGATVLNADITASATLTGAVDLVNDANGYIFIDGEINISSTGGTVSFEYASATSGQTSTVYQLGTLLTVKRLN